MTLLLVSFIAGVLTVLAPCILPLLPIVIGSSAGRSKATPFIVIGSLAASILLFTYLLKASTLLIDIPPYVWSYLSGGILTIFGLILIFPALWENLPFMTKGSAEANKLVGAGHQKKSVWGDVMVGAALGPVFSTCSPTYFVILATVLPASFFLGTVYLLAYILGLVLVLALIAILGQKLIGKLMKAATDDSWLRRGAGILFLLVGLAIVTGLDKKIETKILDAGIFDVTQVEQKLLDQIEDEEPAVMESAIHIPRQLETQFTTDWSKADPAITKAVSGGPAKDGIPSLDNPTFVSLSNIDTSDSVQAIVLSEGEKIKVYPYNILTWHEIVNDTVGYTPVAITFCPLCGSAIVYDRTLPDGTVSTFGVSGSLLESNMIMYDRATENLWQQSTGKTLAGSHHPAELSRVGFQLQTLGEIRTQHPDAMILSEETGHNRNYTRNPYADYETNNRFAFEPSNIDTTFPPKSIMAVFRAGETSVAAPWLDLRAVGETTFTHETVTYTLTPTEAGELTITTNTGETVPFYFEMWFSFAVQHEEHEIITP